MPRFDDIEVDALEMSLVKLLAGQSVQLQLPLNFTSTTMVEIGSGSWQPDWGPSMSSGGLICNVQDARLVADNAGRTGMYYVTPKGTLDSIIWTVKGGPGHVALPGAPKKQAFLVYKVPLSGTSSLLATITDDEAVIGTYESVRTIPASLGSVSFNPVLGDRLLLVVQSEYGTNAKSQYQVLGVELGFTLSVDIVVR